MLHIFSVQILIDATSLLILNAKTREHGSALGLTLDDNATEGILSPR